MVSFLKELAARRWARRLAWAAGLYLLAAGLSWKAVPWAVRRACAQVPKSLPGFQAGVAQAAFNPFTLRLSLQGLYLTHDKLGDIASCRAFTAALKPTALLRLAVGLRELKLAEPRASLAIAPDGSTLLDALPKPAPAPAAEAKPKAAFVPRLVVDVLEVSDGELRFESRLRSAPQRLLAKPIHFRLENLSTLPKDGGTYLLRARTDRDERLSWEGEMTLRPLRVWGRVALDGADLSRLSTAAPDLPAAIDEGRLDASTAYDVALDSRALTVSLRDARASVAGLLWRLKARPRDQRGPFSLSLGPAKASASAALGTPGGRLSLAAETPVAASGMVRLKAHLTPKPLAAEVQCEVSALPLAPFSPLAPPPTRVSLDSGTLGLRARAGLSGGEVDAEVSLSLADLTLSDQASRRALARLGRLAVENVRVSTKARLAEVAAVRVERPFLRLARGRDGRTNLEAALGIALSSASAQAPAAASRPAPAASGAPWRVRLKRFSVSGGRLLAQDESVAPPFALTISEARAELAGLCNDGRSTATFSAQARVESAPVSAAGQVRLSTAAVWVEARLKGAGIQLPLFSPYSGRMLGYKIDKGALSFDLDHRLDGRSLSTKNRAILDQLTLGAKVESPDAVKAPVKLGLAILKDRKGVIDLDVPIDGSLDDPEFHIGKVIVKTIVNLIVKAAVSPFAALGQLLGTKDDLGKVAFPAGEAALAPAAAAQAAELAQALADRPEMQVGVRGTAGRSDALALGDRALRRRLRGPDAGGEALTPKEQARLGQLYQEAFGAPAPALEESRGKLARLWRASDAELRTLALSRANAIKDALAARGVAPSRFFSLEPSAGADAADEPCQLQLDVP